MGLVKFLMIFRDLSRRAFLTCSLPTEQVRRIERGRYEDALASSTEPRGLVVLAGRCFDLQSAYWCCNLRLAYQTAFGLYPLLFYKESAFCFGCFFCLSQ